MEVAEVAIIGAGPIGLELAVGLQQAGVETLQFEAGQIGQTVSRYPKQTRFFSSPDRIAICGVPLQTADQSKATREEYLAYLRGVVAHHDLDVRTFERVTKIEKDGDGFILETDHLGTTELYRVRRVVLAVGDMAYPRLLHIPGEDLAHVSHRFDEPHLYFRKRLLIVGGKNSAVEAAIRCHHAGAKVSISYRRDQFDPNRIKYWLLPEIEAMIKTGKIGYYPNTIPKGITTNQVTLHSTLDQLCNPIKVDVDFVLLLTGYVMDNSLFKMIGVQLDGENQAPVFNPQTMETNIPGVFVTGTAAAGTQVTFRLFIENCHHHVPRIVAAITGAPPPADTPVDSDPTRLES